MSMRVKHYKLRNQISANRTEIYDIDALLLIDDYKLSNSQQIIYIKNNLSQIRAKQRTTVQVIKNSHQFRRVRRNLASHD